MTILNIYQLYDEFHAAVDQDNQDVAVATVLEIGRLTGPTIEQPPEIVAALRNLISHFPPEITSDERKMDKIAMFIGNSEQARLQYEAKRKNRVFRSTLPEFIFGSAS